MKLLRMRVLRAPGLPRGLALDGLDPELNLVLGPNASGKSTFCRAARRTLWPDAPESRGLEAVSTWRSRSGDTLEAQLQLGQRRWQGSTSSGSPQLPGREVELAYELSMRDLLASEGSADQSIAERIARELAGGYDLGALRARFETREAPNRTKKARLSENRAALSALEKAQEALAEREQRLAELDASVSEGEVAKRLVQPLEAALRLEAARRAVAELELRLAAYPPEIERLRGDEVDRLRELEEEVARATSEIDRSTTRMEELAREQEAIGLRDGPIHPETLDAWGERLRAWREAEKARDEAQAAAHQAARAREIAALAVRGPGGGLEAPDSHALQALERSLQAGLERRSLRDALRLRLDGLPPPPPPTAGTPEATLGSGISFLRKWLQTPAPAELGPQAAPRRRSPALSVGLGFGGAIILGVGLYLGQPALVGLGSAVFGVAVGLWLGAAPSAAPPGPPLSDAREPFARAFTETGLAAPSSWTVEAVSERLRRLEAERDALQSQEKAAAELQRERSKLEAELTALDAEEARHLEREGALVAAHALQPELFGLSLVETVERLRSLRETTAAAELAESELRERAQAVLHARAAVIEFLLAQGEAEPADPIGAEASLKRLRSRSEDWRRLDREREQALRARAQAESTTRAARERLDQLLAGAGSPEASRDRLLHLIERRPEHRADKQQLDLDRRELERLKQSLTDHPELLALPREELERRLAEAKEREAAHEELLDERAQLRADLEAAGKRTTLEDAIAAWKSAEAELLQDRGEVLLNVAARWLIDHVESLYESEFVPPLLERARTWFARFTHHAYDLEITKAGGLARLAARETASDELRSLEQLSDGTRVQLLLAARMAYLGQFEGDEPLPLFLDEVLSTTDQARFEAIAGCLFELAAEGRQIFYLTANPADVLAWRRAAEAHGRPAPHLIELGDHAPAELEQLSPPPRPVVPSPAGHTPEQYAELIGVPPVDPEAPVSSWHLYYVAREALDTLHAVLEHGIRFVGQWESFRHSALASSPRFDPAGLRRVDLEIELARHTHSLVRVGRGRRVTIDALAESEAVSTTFTDAARAQLELTDGDPVRTFEAIAGLPRFRRERRDQLHEYLVAEGYLDERRRFTWSELLPRVSEAMRAELESEALASERFPTQVRWYAELSGLELDETDEPLYTPQQAVSLTTDQIMAMTRGEP